MYFCLFVLIFKKFRFVFTSNKRRAFHKDMGLQQQKYLKFKFNKLINLQQSFLNAAFRTLVYLQYSF